MATSYVAYYVVFDTDNTNHIQTGGAHDDMSPECVYVYHVVQIPPQATTVQVSC